MKAEAATITVTVMIDLEDMTPDIQAHVVVEPEFSFLGSNRDILAAWLRKVANDLEAGIEVSDD